MRKAFLLCGTISSLLYVFAIDVLAARQHPEYHNYRSQMVSELMAVGAPTRRLLVWLFIPYNLLVFALTVGLWTSAGPRRSVRLTAGALAGYAAVSSAGLMLAPMDVRGTVDSHRDRRHILTTIVMSLFVLSTMVFGAFTQGRAFRLYSLTTVGVVTVFGALAGFLARPMPGPTPRLGLAERVNIYATMLWIAVLGLSFWRPFDSKRQVRAGLQCSGRRPKGLV